ncbi:gene transfer agent family protein [Allosphingosinicella flava]|uniref:Gene transfer agent family protein n=1 Tax=Allosphingosinicella flava TaxID=2771430 RepID=A0A7T2LNJ5_9SPHN|nr:gene transfer agent family protein [Sphingosinicella flava]QPQ56257.1 gene transfer agent family protein [Sphingosinicella flava]
MARQAGGSSCGGRKAITARGEAALIAGGETLLIRPTFAALVAAEEELGPLFPLAERAAAGGLTVSEMAGLFWHCVHDRPETCTRDLVGAALVEMGLGKAAPLLRTLLTQILQGR